MWKYIRDLFGYCQLRVKLGPMAKLVGRISKCHLSISLYIYKGWKTLLKISKYPLNMYIWTHPKEIWNIG